MSGGKFARSSGTSSYEDSILNGEEQSFENPVVNIDGKLYVPLNEFAGKLDMKVKGNKIEQKVNLTSKGDDILISVYLCPSDTSGVVYRMDLFNDGRLSTTVGVGEIPIEAIENLDKDMLPAVSPKVTRYKNLSGSTQCRQLKAKCPIKSLKFGQIIN